MVMLQTSDYLIKACVINLGIWQIYLLFADISLLKQFDYWFAHSVVYARIVREIETKNLKFKLDYAVY
jgi:hypothetical protein